MSTKPYDVRKTDLSLSQLCDLEKDRLDSRENSQMTDLFNQLNELNKNAKTNEIEKKFNGRITLGNLYAGSVNDVAKLMTNTDSDFVFDVAKESIEEKFEILRKVQKTVQDDISILSFISKKLKKGIYQEKLDIADISDDISLPEKIHSASKVMLGKEEIFRVYKNKENYPIAVSSDGALIFEKDINSYELKTEDFDFEVDSFKGLAIVKKEEHKSKSRIKPK